MRRHAIAVAALATLALVAAACGSDDGGTPAGETGMNEDTIHVADIWARSPSRDVAAVYFTAHNGAEEADRLVAVSTPAAGRAEMHETVEVGGQMQMSPVDSIEIGPDEEVVFEPGGYHVMLFDLTAPLEVGNMIDVTLTFENAGDIRVEALVKEYVPDEGMDMGGKMTGPTGSTASASS
jgi:periplasmic copper chaperone A